MEQFTDWGNLGTMAGAVAAVLVIIQLIKAPLDRVWKIPTRLLVYVLALVIICGALAAQGAITWASVGVALINAAIVALAAMGAYEATFKTKEAVKSV